jgi:DUF1365 family protein
VRRTGATRVGARPDRPASALYEGTVFHRRREPVEHRLSYRVFMTLLDLDELPEALDAHPLWSARRPAPIRFRAADHLAGEGPEPARGPGELAERARALVDRRLGRAPEGPVRLLAMPRVLGAGFNPVSFVFLFDGAGERPEALIAEVTNTPWRERHAYVIEADGSDPIRARFDKRLHVSPFHPMEQSYRLAVSGPGERIGVTISNSQDGREVFDARLSLERRELTRAAMTRVLLRHPPAVPATVARIYWNGLKLRLKGVPHHRKPQGRPAARAG